MSSHNFSARTESAKITLSRSQYLRACGQACNTVGSSVARSLYQTRMRAPLCETVQNPKITKITKLLPDAQVRNSGISKNHMVSCDTLYLRSGTTAPAYAEWVEREGS